MEPVGECNKLLFTGPDTGKLQGPIGRLRTGIGEEGLVHTGNFNQFLRKVSLVGNIVQVGAMDELMGLVADRLHDSRVAVPGAAHGNSCNAVDIFLTFRIPDF